MHVTGLKPFISIQPEASLPDGTRYTALDTWDKDTTNCVICILTLLLSSNSMNHLSFRISFLRARRRMVEMGTDLGIRNRSTLTLVVSLVTVIDFLPWRGRKSRDCLLCNVFGMLLLLP
ncbi:hypothetical protein ABKN59_011114 [Abortiporus biennis]